MRKAVTGKAGDHFSGHAALYADTRPDYPGELFRLLAAMAPRSGVAWDCATGNGQAARALAEYFDTVHATDLSPQQIAQAGRSDRVTYHVATAEASAISSDSIDLIVVAQALHWFDVFAFVKEARRVLKSRGVLAVWCYPSVRVNPEVDDIVTDFRTRTVGPYWPPERRHVESGYRTLHLPLLAESLPPFSIEKEWDLTQFTRYLRSWSASQRYIRAHGQDPVAPVHDVLRRAWGGSGQTRRRVGWPLAITAGRLA